MNVHAETEEKSNSLLIGLVGKQRMTKPKAISESSTGNWGINNKLRMWNIQNQQQLPNTDNTSPLNELEDTLCSKGNERKMTNAKGYVDYVSKTSQILISNKMQISTKIIMVMRV